MGKELAGKKPRAIKVEGEKKGGEISAVNTEFHVCKQHLAPTA